MPITGLDQTSYQSESLRDRVIHLHLSREEITATLEDCAIGQQGRFMFRPTDMHLIESIRPCDRVRIVDLTGWGARVGLLIIGKRGAPGHKHGSVVEQEGPVPLAMQVQRRCVGIERNRRIEKLSGRSWSPAMASSHRPPLGGLLTVTLSRTQWTVPSGQISRCSSWLGWPAWRRARTFS